MRLSFVVLNTKHSKSGDLEEEMFAKYKDSLEDPLGFIGRCYWQNTLPWEVTKPGSIIQERKSNLKSSQPSSGWRVHMKMSFQASSCFPALIVMDTGKYFLQQEKEQGWGRWLSVEWPHCRITWTKVGQGGCWDPRNIRLIGFNQLLLHVHKSKMWLSLFSREFSCTRF